MITLKVQDIAGLHNVPRDRMARRGRGSGRTRPGRTSAYSQFVKEELARLERESPELSHKDRFKIALREWTSKSRGDKKPIHASGVRAKGEVGHDMKVDRDVDVSTQDTDTQGNAS